MLSARRWKAQPPGGEGRRETSLRASQVFMNTATNSKTLICNILSGRGRKRGGSFVITGHSRSRRREEEILHWKANSLLQPPRPSYDASVQDTIWGERGMRRPMGLLHIESARGLVRCSRMSAMSRAMCPGIRNRILERQAIRMSSRWVRPPGEGLGRSARQWLSIVEGGC